MAKGLASADDVVRRPHEWTGRKKRRWKELASCASMHASHRAPWLIGAAAVAAGVLLWTTKGPSRRQGARAPKPNEFLPYERLLSEVGPSQRALMDQELCARLHQGIADLVHSLDLATIVETWTPEVGTGIAGIAYLHWFLWKAAATDVVRENPTGDGVFNSEASPDLRPAQLLRCAKALVERSLAHASISDRHSRGRFPYVWMAWRMEGFD